MTAVLGSCSVRFFASWRIIDEISTPIRSLADLATCRKSRPVPQPTSRTSPFSLNFVLFRATSILAFCSTEY